MAEATTFVYNAEDKVLGRLASVVAKQLISATKAGEDTRVIIVNAEKAIVSGKRTSVMSDYRKKYELNHARKGPFSLECQTRFSSAPYEVCYPTKRTVAAAQPSRHYASKSARRRICLATCPMVVNGETHPRLSARSLSDLFV